MSEISSEKSEMSTTEFCQQALRHRIAPPSYGSVGARILKSSRDLGWGYSRTKDTWYADPRISISPEELFRVEAVSGLVYAKEELRENDLAIQRATALLGGEDTGFVRALIVAFREALSVRDRA